VDLTRPLGGHEQIEPELVAFLVILIAWLAVILIVWLVTAAWRLSAGSCGQLLCGSSATVRIGWRPRRCGQGLASMVIATMDCITNGVRASGL
jgi:hypothetical protein